MSEKENRDWKKPEDQGNSSSFGEELDSPNRPRPADEIYTGQEYRGAGTEEKEKKKKDSIGRDISILVMITLVAGALLGVAYGVTKGPIASAKEQARKKAQKTVMSVADSFETLYAEQDSGTPVPDTVHEALEKEEIASTRVTQIDKAQDKSGNLLGYVVTVTDPDGYGGDVELMCGVTHAEDGTITIEGISFLSLTETAGMGMRAKEEEFQDQFSGKKLDRGQLVAYSKSGAAGNNEIDAISGCTITTSAVTDDVNAALLAAQVLMDADPASPSAGEDTSKEDASPKDASGEDASETESTVSEKEQEASK